MLNSSTGFTWASQSQVNKRNDVNYDLSLEIYEDLMFKSGLVFRSRDDPRITNQIYEHRDLDLRFERYNLNLIA